MDPKTKIRLRDLAQEAENRKDALYVVGGTLRDRRLDREFSDIDLICIDAGYWARWFSKRIHSPCVVLHDEPGHEVFRIPLGKHYFCDFCTRQGNSLEEDLAKRDFTINALAQPLSDFLENKPELIDLHNGIRDLSDRTIRALQGSSFQDDPLRMLRAFRLAAQLNFNIAPATLTAIGEEAVGIRRVSGERISQELLLLFNNKQCDVPALKSSGLLTQLLQSAGTTSAHTENLLTVWQRYHSAWDSLPISLREYQTFYHKIFDEGSNRALFGLSLLFSNSGTEASAEFMKSYKFSNRQIECVTTTVQLYQHIRQFWDDKKETPPKALLYQWATNYEEVFPQAFLQTALIFSDEKDLQESRASFLKSCLDFFINQYLPTTTADTLLSGHDLQESFNLKPSPLFKTLLEKIREARVLGKVSTKEQAEILVRQLIKTAKESS